MAAAVTAAAAEAAAAGATEAAGEALEKVGKLDIPVFPLTAAMSGVLLGVSMGWIMRRRYFAKYKLYEAARLKKNIIEDMTGVPPDENSNITMVICCRADLKMEKGRMAVEVAHAACSCAHRAATIDPDALFMWKNSGQPKKVMVAQDEEELLNMADLANSLGLTSTLIRGAGKESLTHGNRTTVLGIGPGRSEVIEKITGHLKLL